MSRIQSGLVASAVLIFSATIATAAEIMVNGEGAALESHLSTAVRHSEIAELGKRLKSVNDELKRLEDQWLDLSGKLDTVGV